MGILNIASWNAEWMNYWFTPAAEAPALRTEFDPDSQTNNTRQTAG